MSTHQSLGACKPEQAFPSERMLAWRPTYWGMENPKAHAHRLNKSLTSQPRLKSPLHGVEEGGKSDSGPFIPSMSPSQQRTLLGIAGDPEDEEFLHMLHHSEKSDIRSGGRSRSGLRKDTVESSALVEESQSQQTLLKTGAKSHAVPKTAIHDRKLE